MKTFATLSVKIDAALDAQKPLYDFIATNQDKLDISGSVVKIKDPSIQDEPQELMTAANKKARDLNNAANEFRQDLSGR